MSTRILLSIALRMSFLCSTNGSSIDILGCNPYNFPNQVLQYTFCLPILITFPLWFIIPLCAMLFQGEFLFIRHLGVLGDARNARDCPGINGLLAIYTKILLSVVGNGALGIPVEQREFPRQCLAILNARDSHIVSLIGS